LRPSRGSIVHRGNAKSSSDHLANREEVIASRRLEEVHVGNLDAGPEAAADLGPVAVHCQEGHRSDPQRSLVFEFIATAIAGRFILATDFTRADGSPRC